VDQSLFFPLSSLMETGCSEGFHKPFPHPFLTLLAAESFFFQAIVSVLVNSCLLSRIASTGKSQVLALAGSNFLAPRDISCSGPRLVFFFLIPKSKSNLFLSPPPTILCGSFPVGFSFITFSPFCVLAPFRPFCFSCQILSKRDALLK